MLMDDWVYIGLMSLGILMNALFIILWCSILSYFTVWFFKLKPGSMLEFMKINLNSKYWVFSLLFYIDFFGFWSVIIILLGLTGIINSIILWFIVLGFYLLSFILNFFRIY